MERKDITSTSDIITLVDSFYAKVRQDSLLAPIFNSVIQDDWQVHLEVMYTFWETVLLGKRSYYGNPFIPHTELPVSTVHFNQWLVLFNGTLDELFSGEIADEARWRAQKMAEMFQNKIESFRETNKRPLI
ncbi:MAG: group III truncated hemoglobin [Bacteroidota bacterium]